MKAAVLRAPRDLKIEDVPVPEADYGEVLVRIKSTAICGTDISFYEGKTEVDYPRILGHESAGEVVETGDGVNRLKKGDRVVLCPAYYCGSCVACLEGKTGICENGGLLGREFDGTYAEYVAVPEKMALKLPDSISLEEATTFIVLTTATYAQRKIDIFANHSVAIVGEGPAGLMHTQLAKLNGADPVIGISRSQWKIDLAVDKYGADYTFNENVVENVMELTGGRGVDYVIECVGKAVTLNQATELVRPGGTIVSFGITPPQIDGFKSYALYYKDISLIGSRAMQPVDWPLSIDLAAKGKIDLGSIITHRIPLDDLEEGFEMMNDRSKKVLRIIVEI